MQVSPRPGTDRGLIERPKSFERTPGQLRQGDARPGDRVGTRTPAHHTPRHFDRPPSASERPPYHQAESRYARPSYRHVGHSPYVYYGPPAHYWYTPYYTHWWMHPYHRYTHMTWSVVGFGWTPYAWHSWWIPPPRPGFVWMPGFYAYDMYYPGYWSPMYMAPPRYAYVPGHWAGRTYVEGYYRSEERDDGDWRWVEGYYLPDGTYVEGHWHPNRSGPAGYVWEPGFFDGEVYVDGFWRPEFRSGYVWVSASYAEDGVRESGYWLPLDSRDDEVWIPGWFDGEKWVPGYWVTETEFRAQEAAPWTPPAGVDAGWSADAEPTVTPPKQRLALPIEQAHRDAKAIAPPDAPPDTMDVALRRADFSAYPQVTLEVGLTHREGAVSGTSDGWKAEVWDDGANVDATLAFVEATGAQSEVVRVTYTTRTPEADPREVVLRLSRDGQGNGYGGSAFQVP